MLVEYFVSTENPPVDITRAYKFPHFFSTPSEFLQFNS